MKENERTIEVFRVERSIKQRLAYASDFLVPSVIVGGILSFCGALAIRRYLQVGSTPILLLGTLAILMALVLWSVAIVYMPRNFSLLSNGSQLHLRTRGRCYLINRAISISSISLNRIPMYWVKVSTDRGTHRLFSRSSEIISEVFDIIDQNTK